MLDLVRLYRDRQPGNVLEKYLPALERVNGTPSHDGLDPDFQRDWRAAAQGGDEVRWLHAFLDERKLNLERPLQWQVYGDSYAIW